MKQLIQKLGLLIAMLLAILQASAYDFEVDGIQYTITSTADLTCEVAGCSNSEQNSISIPEQVTYLGKNLTVTAIGMDAFKESNIEYVTLSATVKSLGARCFEDSHLKKISPSTSITNFDLSCFSGCEFLEEITFNEQGVEVELASSSFYGCRSLKNLLIPSNVVFPGYRKGISCFSYCTGLEKVTIDCKDVPERCFEGCSSLKEYELGSKCESLGNFAFKDCISLSDIYIPTALRKIGDGCFQGCTSLKTSLIIPEVDTPLALGKIIFADCTSLESVEWYKMEKIPIGTFKGCINLKSLKIGERTSGIEMDGTIINEFGTDVNVHTFGGCNIKKLIFCVSNEPLELNFNASSFEGHWEPFSSVEDLYVEREIVNDAYFYYGSVEFNNLKRLTLNIGTGSIYRAFDLESMFKNLELLKSDCIDPPALAYSFTTQQYTTLEVEVPEEAIDAYKNADVWRNFWNIKGVSGIDDVKSDVSSNDRKVTVYNLQGQKMNVSDRNELSTLPNGLYIVNGEKIVIR